MTELSEKTAILAARKAELTKALFEIEDRLDDAPSRDWEDRATERQGDEVLEALGLHDASELREVEAALLRIAQGTYGTCTKCGRAINEARLNVIPETPFCAHCAS